MSQKKAAKLLTSLKIHEVSSVDRGAGVGARVMLLKRDAGVGRPTDSKMEISAMSTPEKLAKREAKIVRKVEKAIARIREGQPSLTAPAAFLRFAQSREHGELWQDYRKLGGPRLPWQGPTEDINGVPSQRIAVIAVSPLPARTTATGRSSLEDLVSAHMKAHPPMGRAQAYAAVMRTPTGAETYTRERGDRLARAAAATGAGAARPVAETR